MIINSKKDETKYKRSSLELTFERIWTKLTNVDLVVEASPITGRRFRVDYLQPETKVVIEIHGGQYMRVSGHSSVAGKVKDAEKQNLLVVNGYLPFVLWSSMVTQEEVQKIVEFVNDINK